MKNKYIKLFEDIVWEEWDYEEEDPFFLDEFIGHEKFYEFLKENNCLDQWIEEMNKRGKNIKEYLDKSKERELNFSDYISFSFSWNKTKQGYIFWLKICENGNGMRSIFGIDR